MRGVHGRACKRTNTACWNAAAAAALPCTSPGEWIIRHRPQAVVVETSLGPEHGSMPGNVIGCKDHVVDRDADFYLRMFCQVGRVPSCAGH